MFRSALTFCFCFNCGQLQRACVLYVEGGIEVTDYVDDGHLRNTK